MASPSAPGAGRDPAPRRALQAPASPDDPAQRWGAAGRDPAVHRDSPGARLSRGQGDGPGGAGAAVPAGSAAGLVRDGRPAARSPWQQDRIAGRLAGAAVQAPAIALESVTAPAVVAAPASAMAPASATAPELAAV